MFIYVLGFKIKRINYSHGVFFYCSFIVSMVKLNVIYLKGKN